MTNGVIDPNEPAHPLPPTQIEDESSGSRLSETTLRIITALWLVPLISWIVVLGGLPYLAMATLIVVLGQREFYRLIEDKGMHPIVGLGVAFGVALQAVAYLGNEYHVTLLLTASLLGLMVAQLRKAQVSESLTSISCTFFGVFYVGWLFSHAIVLRNFYWAALSRHEASDVIALQLDPGSGIFFMFYAMSVLINCDAGAYFAGRAWGRRKLSPRISPGKSVEGALGGIVVGVVAGMICKLVFDTFWPHLSAALPWSATIPFGIVLSLVGITGDLVESLLKRDAEVKDTGALLAGMGGVLDRIDSPLLGIPVMYYMLLGYVLLRLA